MEKSISRRELNFEEYMSFRPSRIGETPAYGIKELKKRFGQPSRRVCEKVDYKWTVALKEGEKELAVFTIYDYYGERWHIGGDDESLYYIEAFTEVLEQMMGKA